MTPIPVSATEEPSSAQGARAPVCSNNTLPVDLANPGPQGLRIQPGRTAFGFSDGRTCKYTRLHPPPVLPPSPGGLMAKCSFTDRAPSAHASIGGDRGHQKTLSFLPLISFACSHTPSRPPPSQGSRLSSATEEANRQRWSFWLHQLPRGVSRWELRAPSASSPRLLSYLYSLWQIKLALSSRSRSPGGIKPQQQQRELAVVGVFDTSSSSAPCIRKAHCPGKCWNVVWGTQDWTFASSLCV